MVMIEMAISMLLVEVKVDGLVSGGGRGIGIGVGSGRG